MDPTREHTVFDFTQAAPSSSHSPAELRAARRSLLDGRSGMFQLADSRVSLAPDGPAHLVLSALSECGEMDCACCRARDPRARPFFRRGVVRRFAIHHAGSPLRYCSVGAGLLLSDAEILSGLIEDAGATVESVELVDSEDLYDGSAAAHDALRQLAAFVAPASVRAYTSMEALVSRAEEEGRGINLLVACDAGTDVSRAFKRTASAVLCDGGLALTLMNGGDRGVTMRGWRRLPGATPSVAEAPPWPAPQVDETLRLEEMDLRRAAPTGCDGSGGGGAEGGGGDAEGAGTTRRGRRGRGGGDHRAALEGTGAAPL